ncbi:pyruvate dehydrogenase (acetyl-transferring) E1 component subunit alpha [Nakamurella deserti]|uniref:pyruvate dehydrogenase (acetyl-transferring) E1 component subunit alpha n=1 Tax=Nakamurella deserti TaxID=2164074 RepID=UPI000DBE3159|nr:pyruvate dehydrogenase (acetyl-transferring) E1 component subunit alpha [Nakamurella deserti]
MPSQPSTHTTDTDSTATASAAAARGAAGTSSLPQPHEVMAGLRATVSAPGIFSLLSPEGEYTPSDRFPLDVTPDLVRDLYRDMVLVRRVDREGNALQRQGQLGLWAPLLGQEAAQIGAGRAMRPQDMAFPSYREHGVAHCRGIPPVEIASIFRGIDFGSWNPREKRFNSYAIVIGNQVINAVGWAMGQRLDGAMGDEDTAEATIAFFGDGATSQGDVHEGMVFAAAFNAPVVFYCQNNQWAISESIHRVARMPLYERAAGYGFPGIRVDGNDVLACLAVTAWALDECRSGNGPVMIEAFTYRMDAHTTSDDPSRYRMADETQAWKLLDPIERVKAYLARNGLADAAFFEAVAAESDALAADFRTRVVNLPAPSPSVMFDHVYATPHPQVEAQRAAFEEYLAGFADTDATTGGDRTGGRH